MASMETGIRSTAAKVCCVLVRGFAPFGGLVPVRLWRALPQRLRLPGWVLPGSQLRDELNEALPGCDTVIHEWRGTHTQAARHAAAMELAAHINRLRLTHRRIIVIGHSHGGNVAIGAAYHAPLAPLEIITLNTPFLRAASASDKETRQRIQTFLGATAVTAATAVGFWQGGRDYLVWVTNLVVLAVLVWLAVRVPLSRLIHGALSGQSEDLRSAYASTPVRRGVRCLVVTHSGDEILRAFRDLRAWVGRYFKRGQPRSEGDVDPPHGSRILPRRLPLLIGGFLLVFFAGSILSLLSAGQPPAVRATLLVVSAILLIVAYYYLMIFIAMMFSISLFFLAVAIFLVIRPIFTLGFPTDGFFFAGSLDQTPRVEAGAIIERFDNARSERSYFQALLDDLAAIRHPRFSPNPLKVIAEFVRVTVDTIRGMANMAKWIVRTAVVPQRHIGVYNDPEVHRRVRAWL